jgi:hypothetical protein
MNLMVHHLRFTLRAATHIHLGPQAGAQIRGALWEALQQFACNDPAFQGNPGHSRHCPMCRLMRLETAEDMRGVNPPRPFAVRPPLSGLTEGNQLFHSDDIFTVGINLFGDVVTLFPYVCQAFYRMGDIGIGYGRGRFILERVEAVDPFSAQSVDLLQNRRIVAVPGLPVTDERIRVLASMLSTDRLFLRFLTPVFIVHKGQRQTKPVFETIIARLLERCQRMELHYTDQPAGQSVWRESYITLTEQARAVHVVEDRTRWVEVLSGSRRTGGRNSISGFVGDVVFEGDLAPFREWLLWGQSLHVGKNVVKGNGWYELVNE